MYLSKLEIIGFKSFAHKTLLKYDAGMTAIVGPNGCGKTNVVDAIRWALGEQKAGTLRSDVMENVIFNGTRTRKPLGMAEVSLTIENTKGILPTEYSEVTITRRLFRSGESEYLLNKTQCRLKDIIELFMDTGMGANAYSVIELKMIETILSDRTEERRKLFEEAAGVTKYKSRRKEALRKLDQVSMDVSRVDDIVKEVTKSVSSLERQADKAKLHAEYSGRLRTLEVELLEREYAVNLDRIEPLKSRLTETLSTRDKISDEVLKYEALLDVIEREAAEIEEQLVASERAVKEKSGMMQRTRETMIATEERIRSLNGQRDRAIQERERLEKDRKDLAQRIATLTVALQTAIDSRAELEDEKREKEAIRAEADRVVRSRRDDLRIARDKVYSVLNQRNQKSNELERRKARIEELERRLQRFDGDYKSLEQKQAHLEQEATAMREQFETASAKVAQQESELQVAQDEKESLKAKIDQIQNQSFALQNEIGKKISKIEFFTGLVEQGVGAGEAAEFLMGQSGWSKTEAITVADALTTQPELRAAFESALGEVANYLIVDSSKEAFEAVDILRHSQKGKATLICLDRVPKPSGVTLNLPQGARSAVAEARFAPRYADLFHLLFDGIVIVDSIQEGFAVLDANPDVEKCVTSEGEVITHSGFVRGGSKKSTEGILIGKREQIEELELDVQNMKAELDTHDREIAEVNRAFEAIVLKEFNNRLRLAEEERRKIQSRISQIEYEIKRTREQHDQLTGEEERLKKDRAPLAESLDVIADEVARFEKGHQEALEASTVAQAQVEEAEKLLAEQAQRSTEVQVRYAGLSSEVFRLESDKKQTERAIETAAQSSEQRLKERERVEADLADLSGKLEEFKAMLASLTEELTAITARRDEVAEARKEKQGQAHTYREALREERAQQDQTVNATHELELKIQELESKLVAITTRAREEFEIAEIERKSYDDGNIFSFGEAREAARDLKQKIRNLGAVNLLAYDEFVTEKERLEFLTVQRKDLIDAQKNLAQTIEEINTTATRQFLDTFELIRKNFQDIFRSLFTEGDECDLKLEDDKDPLEAQIEIIAKPRGKRPHSIELLSGGEKTMTAIALLFAIYLVKPSPFCILDEVDAPLDDSNIDRFLNILRRFAVDTQFIVVTHNKRTMAAADALYGVTQEEDGISKIVSVRLKKEGTIVGGSGKHHVDQQLVAEAA